MELIRPRLTDCYNIFLSQEQIDFLIPVLDEDLPFYVDPFLLWKSPSQQDNSLHRLMIDTFNNLGKLYLDGDKRAVSLLVDLSECEEAGLGYSGNRKGLRISNNKAREILDLYHRIPQIGSFGIRHIEIIQLFIDQFSKDRISDIACSILKSFLIDYSIDQSKRYNIPLFDVEVKKLLDTRRFDIIQENVRLPINPETKNPILLIPKRWLRKNIWINTDDYFDDYLSKETQIAIEQHLEKGEILQYNRNNYDIVSSYVEVKERKQSDCKNDPLFTPIPIYSAKRKLNQIKKLPTGKKDNADIKYEKFISQLFASVLYPHLDFAETQSRIDSGSQIRDLIFYNNRSIDFLDEIYKDYDSKQLIMEMKNVFAIKREHINQLNRYLSNQFGNFGIIITRNPLSKAMFKNTIDLWSGHRKCIIALTDVDVEMMVNIFEDKQRLPYEVIKKKYLEFTRKCPG